MRATLYVIILLATLLVVSCSETEPQVQTPVSPIVESKLLPPERPCGNSLLVDVEDLEGSSVGVLELLNDERHFWISFSPTLSYKLARAHLFIGDEKDLPRDQKGNDLQSEFPIRLTNDAGDILWNHYMALDGLPECFVVAASIQVADREVARPLPNQIVFSWALGGKQGKGPHSIPYCLRSCRRRPDECIGGISVGDFRTFSPEGWQEAMEQQPWGRFIDENFAAAFPNGLEVGCDRRIRLTSATALRRFFPATGPGGVLVDNVDDPTGIKNGLAAELCALGLAMALDEFDDDFCASPANLSTLVVTEGPFSDWRIGDLIAEGNDVLGGCTSNYSAGQMEEVIRNINLNFAAAEVDQGFLRCAGE